MQRSGSLLEEAAAHRGLAGADLAGEQHEAAAAAHAVQQVRQRLAVALAHEEVARIRRDRERPLLQPEVTLVHRRQGYWPGAGHVCGRRRVSGTAVRVGSTLSTWVNWTTACGSRPERGPTATILRAQSPVNRFGANAMKTRAAVAWKAGKPLTIEEVDLEGPRAGEVLVEVKATGICHTDYYTLSGADPEGLFPAILGHEGAGVVVEVGAGVTTLKQGRPRHSALHAGVPAVQVLPVAQDQPVPADPRHAGQGPDARRQLALLARRQAAAALHGHAHLRQPHRRARRSRWRRSATTRPSTWSATSAAASPPASARCIFTAKVEAGANVVVFGLGGIGLNVIQGAKHGRRRQDHRHRHQPGARGDGAPLRHDALHQPEGSARTWSMRSCSSPTAAPTTASSASATPTTMRQALECCHKGWGPQHHHRRGGGGAEIARGRSSSSPAASGKARPSAARAAAPTCPKIVDWYMDGKHQHRRADHAPAEARGDQRRLRADEARRVDPLGGRLLNVGRVHGLSEHACFGGVQGFYRHESSEIGLPMQFGVYPPAAGEARPRCRRSSSSPA